MVDSDRAFMARALFHAARGQGRTTPNPMVGAVVLDARGIEIGHGWHERAGEAHAEVNALDEAGEAARGGTLFVTLEPCCHTGRTPPCTRRIIDAGIARVVAAMRDPDTRVSGRGFHELRAAGIDVSVGLCEPEATRLNDAYITVKTRGRPLVVLKAATSLDGRIGERGRSTRLTSAETDRKTQRLRAAIDAIAVGSETVVVDNPLLTSRLAHRIRPLVRVVFDRRLRTPPGARLFSTLADGPVIIVTSPEALAAAPPSRLALDKAGAVVRPAADLRSGLAALLDWDVSTLLVEGGARLHAAFWEAGLVDRVHLLVAPIMLGAKAIPLFDGYRVPSSELDILTAEPRGADVWIEADVHRNH
jgi:diaminohydroxyphosphoribosylaminopyrimidine deaminase / 5-amino-6-(5-phosphoribosylamino)uracil reductase